MRNKKQTNNPMYNLHWCEDCPNARKETRFYLILLIMNEFANKNKEKHIHYVAFGTGKLLQDYLTIKALMRIGFKHININVIDIGYGGKEDLTQELSVEGFEELKKNGFFSSYPEEGLKALNSFRSSIKEDRVVVTAYATYNEFLAAWGKKPVDILLLVDPMRFKKTDRFCSEGELLLSKKKYTNHFGISFKPTKGDATCNVIALLPYKGAPEIFYKGDITKDIEKSFGNMQYKNHNDRIPFILKLAKKYHNLKKEDFCITQSQRYAFYEIIQQVATENTLVLQLEGDNIYTGAFNLRALQYEKKGYKKLLPIPKKK
ncbi:hypothetical protein ACFLYA_01880 [Candidatus Dependentiae bacterium]